MKTPPDVTAYFLAAPPERAERLCILGERIVGRFPGARISMRYRMPTFEIGVSWIAIANQKSYVSVYTCARHHIESYLKLHPATKAGTGCLNFPDKAEIDMKALDAVIDSALNAAKLSHAPGSGKPRAPAKKGKGAPVNKGRPKA